MAVLTLFSDNTGKGIAQYDTYYNQYNLSRNQIKHVNAFSNSNKQYINIFTL